MKVISIEYTFYVKILAYCRNVDRYDVQET